MTLTRRAAGSKHEWWLSQAGHHMREAEHFADTHVLSVRGRRKLYRGADWAKGHMSLSMARALRALLEAWR